MSEIEIYKMLRFCKESGLGMKVLIQGLVTVSYETAKVSSYNTMPGSALAAVKLHRRQHRVAPGEMKREGGRGEEIYF